MGERCHGRGELCAVVCIGRGAARRAHSPQARAARRARIALFVAQCKEPQKRAMHRIACLLALLPLLEGTAPHKTNGKGKPTKAVEQRCSSYVTWVMRTGVKEHPERYPGLTVNSTRSEVQHHVHRTMPKRCPDSTGSNAASSSLPSFTATLGLNASQRAAYRKMRKRHATDLNSQAFKDAGPEDRARWRKRIAMTTLQMMRTILNETQLAIFRNSSASPRRPPAMHVAASLWKTLG